MYKKVPFIAIFLTMVVCLCSCMGEKENTLTMRVLKIGKADAIILQTDSGAVLVDTGEEEDGAEILEKASAQGITKFDYLILTHYDKDHVGGAAEVINGMAIGEIIEPGYAKESDDFDAFEEAADRAGIKRTVPQGDVSLELDGVAYTILMPQKDFYENENDYSIVVKAEYNGYSMLLAGDMLDERTEEILGQDNLSADVLKVPHHGSFEESSRKFFQAVNPRYSIITCSGKNPADKETIQCLEKLDSEVYLTAEGDIKVIINKEGIEVLQ